MRKPLLWGLLMALCWLAPADLALSQTLGGSGGGGSADLLQMFQSLSPEQQDTIMKQLGVSGGAGSILGLLGGGGASQGSQGAQGRRGQSTRNQAGNDESGAEETTVEETGLNGDDWVIVLADLPGNKPAATQPPSMAAAAPPGSGLAPGAGALPPSVAANPAAQAQIASLIAASGATPPAASAPAPDLQTQQQRDRLQPLVDLIRSRNPYRLSHDGALTLPGFAPINVLGLSDEQATMRLSVEPALLGLDIHLAHLPLRKSGAEGLKPFGYDLFGKKPPSTFAPFSNVPLPSDYIVGAGDEIDVQLYGNQNRSLKLTVSRDGHVDLPRISVRSM